MNKPVTELIRQRFSCRRHPAQPIAAETQQKLQEFLDIIQIGPFGSRTRLALIAASDQERESLKGVGTYGFIKNPQGYIVGAMGPGDKVLKYGALQEAAFQEPGGESLRGWIDRCPHAGFPLAIELDRYLTPDAALILCGWHGAVFEPMTGECRGGPCAGGRLTPWPVAASGGVIRTA